MDIQYPHKLFIATSGESYRDADGNWVNPVGGGLQPATALDADCRDQPSDKGKSTVVVDGQVVEYGSIVYCMPVAPEVKRGDTISVRESDGHVRLEGTVKRFSRDAFHNRIWV